MAFRRRTGMWTRGVLLFLLVSAAFGIAIGGAGADPSECGGAALLTWKPAAGGQHELSAVTVKTGHRSRIATLPFEINAIGYSEADHRLYGLAKGDTHGRFDDAPHLVSVGQDGGSRDLGPLRGPVGDGLSGSYAGTVVNDRLVVLSDTHVVFIDIAEHPGTITSRTTMDYPLKTLRIGDVATLPGSSKLYGLSTTDGSIVSIDPGTGAIGHRPVTGLPATSLVGAVFASPRGELFGVVNGVKGRAVLYRVSRNDPGPGMRAVEVADWPELTSADAAFCAAPNKPTPSHEPSPSRRPSPSPSRSATPPAPRPTPPPASSPAARTAAPPPSAPASRPEHRPVVRDRPIGGPPYAANPRDEPEKPEPPKQWIVVGAVVIGMAGAAGVKAAAKRGKK